MPNKFHPALLEVSRADHLSSKDNLSSKDSLALPPSIS
jgi:hypothetical protein